MQSTSLKKKEEFDRVFNKGKRIHGELLTAIIARGDGMAKLGMIVNSKYGGSVDRNKVKRKIREAFRAVAGIISVKLEIVIIPKAQARSAKMQELYVDLSNIIRRAGIK